jgi:hypothetical protein
VASGGDEGESGRGEGRLPVGGVFSFSHREGSTGALGVVADAKQAVAGAEQVGARPQRSVGHTSRKRVFSPGGERALVPVAQPEQPNRDDAILVQKKLK